MTTIRVNHISENDLADYVVFKSLPKMFQVKSVKKCFKFVFRILKKIHGEVVLSSIHLCAYISVFHSQTVMLSGKA